VRSGLEKMPSKAVNKKYDAGYKEKFFKKG
jgi:hypothetical protein